MQTLVLADSYKRMPQVFFNSYWSTESDQKQLHSLLPVSHEYGDKKSILKDGSVLSGRTEHALYASDELRIKTRKRCTVLQVSAEIAKVLACFVAVPDWHASGLDVETFFLRHSNAMETLPMPRVGPYTFSFHSYVTNVYEDLQMALCCVKASLPQGSKCHLKIVPLGVGPSIRTRYGEFLGNTIIPPYLLALQIACNVTVDDTWVDTLEFVDHFRGFVSPQLSLKRVRIISASSRDAFDYGGISAEIVPAIIAPMDPFCVLGGLPDDKNKNIAFTMASASDLRERVSEETTFIGWPACKDEGNLRSCT